MGDLLQPWHLLVLSIAFSFLYVVFVVPYWFICKKAGFSPWLSVLNLIPFGNIILAFILAFVDWKVVPVQSPQPPSLPPRQ